MRSLEMPFSTIAPFVRYVNVSQYEPGQVVGPRMVYDHQLIYVHRGKGFLEIDGVCYQARPGNLFFYGPRVKHKFIGDIAEPFFLSGIHFDFSQNHTDLTFPIGPFKPEYFDESLVTETVKFKDFQGFCPCIHLHDYRIAEILLQMLDEYNRANLFYTTHLNGLMNVLLSILARHNESKRSGSKPDGEIACKVVEFIHQHYCTELSNEALAEKFHFHPNYLNRLVREYTGRSIRQYLIDLRLRKAFDLLANTNKTIGQVALEVGYQDTHYFSRLVKKKTGFSPEQVKQRF